MARNPKKARRLVVGGETFLWSLNHTHRAGESGRYEDCCESVVLRRLRARGHLRILFREGPGRLAASGFPMSSGEVCSGGRHLNLHEPGTVRALLDEALRHGWCPDDPSGREIDGWTHFDAVVRRREAATRPG
ncbi:hypothetical protein [Streptomyces sp. NPDC020742]|uniref:hypothetical protein n=1 Tax=Streptomyces sp. NPDC020742 TaxID=3154897 RepID=UPI0033EE3A76